MEKLTVQFVTQSFLALVTCLSVVMGDCLTDLMECSKPMPDIDIILLGIEKMNRQQLVQHCDTFSNISECVDKKLYNCEPAEWNSVAKFRETFSSICFDDFREYLAHSECLSQVPGEDVCRDRYKREIVRATKTSKKAGWVEIFTPNGSVGTQELCNATKEYLTCIEIAANATCGSKAAQFQHNLLRKGLVYELDDVDCDLGYSPWEDGGERNRVLVKPGLSLAAVAAIGLAIAVGIAVLAVGSRYLCLKYAGDLDPDEDELLGDDTRSEISTDSSKPGPSRPSTSRGGASTSRGGASTSRAGASASAVV